ncbi:uncharacterized protein [Asterias amurensis]|uniref:uncharacterized protein n=1 Tax=Asterias amurensis TaxID=7602 RepID=UPI003AB24ED4
MHVSSVVFFVQSVVFHFLLDEVAEFSRRKGVLRPHFGVDFQLSSSKMNATTLYVSTCRYILQAEHNDPNTWGDLYRRLPYLRQSLSCCVCAGLLSDPMGPGNSTCQHFVCRNCLGGKMLLKPSCSWCKDYSLFTEVKQLQILLSCYKKLCEYIADTPIARNLVGANGGTNSHSSGLSILQEGMAINDSHYERSRSQDISGFNIVEYLAKASMNSTPAASNNAMQNGHLEGGSVVITNPEVTGEVRRVVNHTARTDAVNGTEAEPYTVEGGGLDEYSVTITPNSDNKSSPKIKIKRKKRLELGHHSQSKPIHPGLNIAKVKRKYQRRSKTRLLASSTSSSRLPTSNGVLDLNALSNTPKKLIISGHRAKLLKAGRKLEIKEGCRCGTGGKFPGLNTCQGHRCPCFVSEIACLKCRCKGCKNPLKASPSEQSSDY